MRAEILTIGDELCRGEIVDTNAAWLAAELWDLEDQAMREWSRDTEAFLARLDRNLARRGDSRA